MSPLHSVSQDGDGLLDGFEDGFREDDLAVAESDPQGDPCEVRGSRIPGPIDVLVRYALGAIFAVAFLTMLLFATRLDYACPREFLLPNWLMSAVGLTAVLLLAALFSGKLGERLGGWLASHQRGVDLAVMAATLALLGAQLLLSRSYVFVSGWDSGCVAYSSWSLALGQGFDVRYYSTYPNNLLLLRLAQVCMAISVRLGATTPEGGVYLFSILNCFSCALAMWLTYWVLSRVTSAAWGLVGWFLFVLLIWTSPWVAILYSDAIMVSVPPLLAALVVAARRSSGIRSSALYAAFGLIVYAAYRIKPQMIFILLSMVGFALVGAVTSWRGTKGVRPLARVGRGLVPLVSLAVGLACSYALVNVSTEGLSAQLDPNRQFGVAHYLMMGLSPESKGVYAPGDVNHSAALPDVESRTKYDLEIARSRVLEYGPIGLADLMLKKLMTNFNDGSFAWGMEGHFFAEGHYGNSPFAPLTRSLYYDSGSRYRKWLTYAQGVWVTVFSLCLPALLDRRGSRRRARQARSSAYVGMDESMQVLALMALSLLMLTAFEQIFEARARYFYAFVTYFIMIATMGIRVIRQRIAALRSA